MLDDEKLTPADRRDVITALTLGLTRGPQRERLQAAEVMSKIVAERLVAELETSGFVVMRKPIPASGAGDNPGRRGFSARNLGRRRPRRPQEPVALRPSFRLLRQPRRPRRPVSWRRQTPDRTQVHRGGYRLRSHRIAPMLPPAPRQECCAVRHLQSDHSKKSCCCLGAQSRRSTVALCGYHCQPISCVNKTPWTGSSDVMSTCRLLVPMATHAERLADPRHRPLWAGRPRGRLGGLFVCVIPRATLAETLRLVGL